MRTYPTVRAPVDGADRGLLPLSHRLRLRLSPTILTQIRDSLARKKSHTYFRCFPIGNAKEDALIASSHSQQCMQGVVSTGLVSLSLSNEWTGANGAYERRPDACKHGPHTHYPSHTNCIAPTIGQQRVTHWPEHATYIWAAPRLARILRPRYACPVGGYFFTLK